MPCCLSTHQVISLRSKCPAALNLPSWIYGNGVTESSAFAHILGLKVAAFQRPSRIGLLDVAVDGLEYADVFWGHMAADHRDEIDVARWFMEGTKGDRAVDI